ncbi:Site-specific recombinase XerD [Phyllobacterium sp. CL33Tsu]|nr:Site-specific recombinase XerD [Phyllobacterium sp. CL33Tsu]
MAKTLKEAKLTTPNARKELKSGVHWRSIDPEIHLGYRKGIRAGRWLVRWYSGEGKYQQATLGTADDVIAEGTLSYASAEKAARKHVTAARLEARAKAGGPLMTVALAVEQYVEMRDATDTKRAGRKTRSNASQRLGKHVTGTPLSAVALHALTEQDLKAWRTGLSEMKTATENRLISDLKAALNAAWQNNRNRLRSDTPTIIKYGLKAAQVHGDGEEIARENQILTDAEVGRLIKAAQIVDNGRNWDGDLYRIVLLLAATGARFSQLVRLRVADVQESRLMVPTSNKGRGTRASRIAVPVGKDVLQALVTATQGRAGEELLLMRWRHKQRAGSIEWARDTRGPWQPTELTPPWQEIRRIAEMADVIPYALRHSSIVRGIRANLPIRLVAALHDTSVQMIEKHYARWIVDGLDELAARAIVPLVH